MFKKSIIASSFMLAALSAGAADYYVVTPVKGRTQSTASISVSLAQSSLPDAQVGSAYSYDFKQNLQVVGDTGYTGYGVSWAVTAGSLPAGLSLNASTGVLSGTPTAGGSASFTISATYKTKNGANTFQIVVPNLAVALAAGSPPQAIVGNAYSYNLGSRLSVTGDTAYTGSGVTWTVVSSTLPAGLYLTSDGYIGGTPTAAGTGSITARATYKTASGDQTYQVVSINISVALSSTTLTAAQVGTAYSYDFKPLLTVSGDSSYTGSGVSWSVVSGALPTGLSLNSSTGVVSGTPTVSGANNFTLRATYRTKAGDQSYDLAVSQPVTASGGTVTYNGNYVIHTFTGNGTFQLTSPSSISANILVVGGGGGGGYDGGGGGGGGQVVYQANYTLTAGSYNVIVGAGGAATTAASASTGAAAQGKQGSASSFGSITAAGGGAGGGKAGVGATGASGGGSGHTGGTTGGSATAGYAGGGASSTAGGGGGGAGSAGALGTTTAGNGGNGVVISMPGLAAATYGCGGGGGTYTTSAYGLACGGSVNTFGTGGNSPTAPRAGLANSGSGGGGGGNVTTGSGQGAAGGSGVVIITYPKTM